MLTKQDMEKTPSVLEPTIKGTISTLVSMYNLLANANTKTYTKLEEDVQGGLTNKIGKLEKTINDYKALTDELKTYSAGKDDDSKALIKTWIDQINAVLENIKSAQSVHEKTFSELKKEIDKYEDVITTIKSSPIGKTPEAESLVKKYQDIIDRKTVSLQILESKKPEFDNLLKDKNSLLEKAKNLKELQVNYDSAIAQITKGTNKEVDAVIDEYNSKKSTMDKDIQVMTDLQGKYIQVIMPYLRLQNKMPDLYSKFNVLVNLYESAFNELSALSDSVKKDRSVVAAFKRIEDFNKVKDEPTIENYGTYNRQYNDFIKNVIKGVRVIENRALSLEDFDKKSLAGKVEYASKMNNILRKTVSDVVSDAIKNKTITKWQADEILKTSKRGVTPIEIANVASDMEEANKSQSNIVGSILNKKAELDKVIENEQDNINDYKKYFQDSLAVIKSFPSDENTEKAIKMIEEAMTATSIKDKIVTDTYRLIENIMNDKSYNTVIDELKQQYEYYYKDNQDVPMADDLLAIPNGRQQMQNLVNVARVKQDQLRDLGTTAGNTQARTAIENKTKGVINAMTKAVNLARQRYKQDLTNRQIDTEAGKLKKEYVAERESPNVAEQLKQTFNPKDELGKDVYKTDEHGKRIFETPENKIQMKSDMTKIVQGISEELSANPEFSNAYALMLQAYNANDVNEFYKQYRIAEDIKNRDMIKGEVFVEYQQMINDLNSKKLLQENILKSANIQDAINGISIAFQNGDMNKARAIYKNILKQLISVPSSVSTNATLPEVSSPTNIEQKTEQAEVQND